MKKRLLWYLVAILTAGLNYLVFYFAAKFFGSNIPHSIAIILVCAMFIHEMGHLIALELFGIPSRMIFLVIIGGTSAICEKDNQRLNHLSWTKQSYVVLAGVIGNIAIIIVTTILHYANYINETELLRITSLNALLVFWNLMPIGKFDGGRFTKMLFDSIEENRDTKFEIGILAWFFLLMMVIGAILGKFSLFNLWLFSWGIHLKAKNDDPNGSHDSRAIPVKQQKWWIIFYLLFFSVALLLMFTTPNGWYLNQLK